MYYLPFLVLSSISLLISTGAAFNCTTTPPVYIDIHSRIVHGSPVFQYGAFMGVSSPAQNQSLFPSLRHNETSVASVSFCSASNLTNCATSTHGNFNPSDSTTWMQDNDYTSTDIDPVASKSLTGRDNIHLYTHFFETDPAFEHLVSNTPVIIATNGSINPGVVGLSQSSTLLRSLFDQGIIAARTFGLYIGSGMDRAHGVVNGSLTLGGYDSGRFSGTVHSYAITTQLQDPFTVGITDVIVDNPNGERNVSLFSTQRFPTDKAPAPFAARLSTDEYTISMPSTLTQNFASLLSTKVSDLYSDDSFALGPNTNGTTMTFVLADGYRVTLPPEVMFNVSGVSPVAARDEKSTAPFTLGLSFLTQVYLAVDYDNYAFHLADAVAENAYVMPQTFCPKMIPKAYVLPNNDEFRKQGLVGAIVGGLIGLIALSTAAVCLGTVMRRRLKEKRARMVAKAMVERSDTKLAFTRFDMEGQ